MTGSRGSTWLQMLLLTLPALLLAALLQHFNGFEGIDHAWSDLLMAHGRVQRQDSRVVLVYFTGETRSVMKYPQNLPRAAVAQYLRKVASLGASAQLVDMLLLRSDDRAGEDEVLRANDELGNIVWIGMADYSDLHTTFLIPLSGRLDRPHDRIAHSVFNTDSRGNIRSASLWRDFPHHPRVPYLGLAGAQLVEPAWPAQLLGADDEGGKRPWYLAPGHMLHFGNHVIPTFNATNDVYFDFCRTVNAEGQVRRADSAEGLFETWTFEDLMRAKFEDGEQPFKGRVVIFGSREESMHDRFVTAVGSVWGPWVHGAVLTGLLEGRFLLPVGEHVVLLLCVLLWLGITVLSIWLSPLRAAAALAGAAALVLAGSAALYQAYGLQVPVTAPLVTCIGAYGVATVMRVRRSEAERRFVRETFSRYAPREIVEILIADPKRLRLGGEAQEVTVLFADIDGFTGITESLGPQQTIEMLNEYFARMTEVVFRNEGLIKQFVGDEIMVIFGAPVISDDHANRALKTAWEMREETARLRAEREAAGKPGFDVKFGINSGVVVVGNIGSPERVEYGAVGDVVNTAARIMALNGGGASGITTRILAGYRTAEMGGAGWTLREVGTFVVKGKAEAILVFELLGREGAAVSGAGRRPA